MSTMLSGSSPFSIAPIFFIRISILGKLPVFFLEYKKVSMIMEKHLKGPGEAILGCNVETVEHRVVVDARLGSSFHQHDARIQALLPTGEVEGRVAVTVWYVQVNIWCFEQLLQHSGVALGSSNNDRCCSSMVHQIRVCAMLDQNAGYLRLATVGTKMERSIAVLVCTLTLAL